MLLKVEDSEGKFSASQRLDMSSVVLAIVKGGGGSMMFILEEYREFFGSEGAEIREEW
jgi:hypothetical protein